MDGWSLQYLRLVTHRAAQRLADIINLIEEGEPWPHQLAHAKVHHEAKTPSKTSAQ